MLGVSYEVPGPDIVFERFDGDLVVLNLSTGKYFGLNPAAAVLWDALVTGVPAADLVAAGAAPGLLEGFLSQLAAHGLLVATPATKPVVLKPEAAAALAALSDVPQIEVFDDLADLILADPIHDVDAEAGWPHLPPPTP